jgi:homoserine dehydrogenase
LIPLAADDPLGGVRGAGNRVVIEWEDGGTTVLEGAGAGGRPTAESVVGDLLAWWRTRCAAGPSRSVHPPALVAAAATR